jgi:hypothetical protein
MAYNYLDEIQKLRGTDQRDAASALIGLFSQYGLETLASRIIDMVKQGFSSDTMSVMLQETPEYKKRFAANDARVAAGLPKLSPAEYIATERQYGQLLSQSGMPKGFYDQQSDYQKFLENDLSPSELNDRIKSWQEVAQSDSATTDELRRLYGMSTTDYAAYLMDPERATPLLQAQARAVTFAGAAVRHGYQVGTGTAEKYGGGAYDVSSADAEKGFQAIQEVQADTDRLSKMYGLGDYGVEDAAAEVFGGDAVAATKRKKAASAERATFSDSSKGNTGRAGSSTSY